MVDGVDARERSWAEALRAERAGDAQAYARFLDAFAQALRRIVQAQFGPLGLAATEVEDVVQDVLIAVHDRRAQWDPARPLLPWLNAITRYKVVDALRRLRREHQRRVDLPEQAWASLLDATAPPDAIGNEEIERQVAALPAGQQAVVRAVGLDGATPREAAGRLGMNEGAVRVAFHRGLKRLMQAAGRREP